MAATVKVARRFTGLDSLFVFAQGHTTSLSLGLSLASIVLAFALGGVLIALAGINPLAAYGFMLQGTFGNLYGFGETLTRFVPMSLSGIGFSLAFKSGFF